MGVYCMCVGSKSTPSDVLGSAAAAEALVVEYLAGLLPLALLQLAIDLLLPLGLAEGSCHVQELVVAQLLAVQANYGGQRRLWVLVGDETETPGAPLLVQHELQGSEKANR